jgi:hypothetical protein
MERVLFALLVFRKVPRYHEIATPVAMALRVVTMRELQRGAVT